MRSFAAALSALAIGGVAASNAPTPCMSSAEASTVAGNFRALIAEPFSTALAEAALTPGYTDYTDSVIELINGGCANGPIPLGSATFSSRDAFIAGQSKQAPITFNIIKVWNNCDTVFLRWFSPNPGFTQTEQQVTGNIIIEAVYNASQATTQPWQIDTSYSEFNSGAWLYDIGNLTCASST